MKLFILVLKYKPQGKNKYFLSFLKDSSNFENLSILIDKPYRSQMETIYSAHRLNAPKSRYDVLLSQRHIQLLGRSVDLNNLICQRMNTYLRQNVDYAISRFEASNITNVIVLSLLFKKRILKKINLFLFF